MKLIGIFVIFLATINLAIADSSKGRGNCNQNVFEEIKDKTQSIVKVVNPTSDCLATLTSDEEYQLLDALNGVNRNYFEGMKSIKERDESIENILKKLNAADDQQKSGVLKLLTAQQNEMIAGQYVTGVIFDTLEGKALSSKDEEIIRGLNIRDPKAYIQEVSKTLAPYYQNLKGHGAQFDKIKGWDLSKVELNSEKIKQDPQLYSSIAMLFSPQSATALSDAQRSESLYIGGQVLTPPKQSNQKGRFPNGNIRVMSRDEHDQSVLRELNTFSRDTEEFMKFSKETASYQNLMKGRLPEMLGFERGDKGQTAPEISREANYKAMLQGRERLKELGVPKEKIRQINEAIKYANELDKANIEGGIEKLELARKAAIAAPFIPLAMAAAPLAGGLYSTSMATVAANASGTLALMPMAFAAGSSLIHATIDKAHNGGDFFCHLSERFSTAGAGALYMAPFLASIPTAAALVSVTPLALGSATGSAGLLKVGAIAAPMI